MYRISPPEKGNSVRLDFYIAGVFLVVAAGLIGLGVMFALQGNAFGWVLLFIGAALWPFLAWERLTSLRKGRVGGGLAGQAKYVLQRLRQNVPSTPVVSISKESVRVGKEFSILYEQNLKRHDKLVSYSIALVYREEIREKRTGEGVYLVDEQEREIQEYLRGPEDVSGGIFYDQRAFTVPENGTPSFSIKLPYRSATHTGKWLVRVSLELTGLPNLAYRYEVKVGPQGAVNGPLIIDDRGWFQSHRYKFGDNRPD